MDKLDPKTPEQYADEVLFPHNSPEHHAKIVAALNAYAAERERAALEQACKAVCDGCAGGRTVENIRGKWWHPTIIEHDGYYTPPMPCKAHAIRALMDGPSGQPDDRYAFRRARGAIPYREGQPMPEDVIRRMRGKDDEPM